MLTARDGSRAIDIQGTFRFGTTAFLSSMKTLTTLLNFGLAPFGKDLGLLTLRLGLGLTMFSLHGLPKLQGFAEKATKFPDPLGIGSQTSLVLATFAEFFCMILLALGLLTRFSALMGFVTMAVVFFLVDNAVLTGDKNGELPFVFAIGYLSLFFAGGGRLSLDRLFGLEK